MTDIEIAIKNLEGHTICLCKNGNCLYSESRGIAPMMNFIENGTYLGGYSVADTVVGKAAALLFIKCGIKEVFAKTLSESARKVLELYNIPVTFQTLTPKIINRAGTGICPMEKAVAETDDPDRAYALLKTKLSTM